MKKNYYVLWAMALVYALLFSCTVFHGKPQLVMYSGGVLSTTLDHGISDVHKATVRAYEDLGITITEAKVNKLSGIVQGTLANGTQADTNLTPAAGQKTQVGIKVNGGNQTYSRIILNELMKKL